MQSFYFPLAPVCSFRFGLYSIRLLNAEFELSKLTLSKLTVPLILSMNVMNILDESPRVQCALLAWSGEIKASLGWQKRRLMFRMAASVSECNFNRYCSQQKRISDSLRKHHRNNVCLWFKVENGIKYIHRLLSNRVSYLSLNIFGLTSATNIRLLYKVKK